MKFCNSFVVVLVVSVWMPSCLAGLYVATDKVIQLNEYRFQNEVLTGESVWIVEFYAPWCGHCKTLAPSYKKVAQNLDGVVRVGAVDCDEDANKSLCARFDVKGFPSLKVFPAKKNGQPVDYNGPRSTKAIGDFAIGFLPSNLVKELTEKSSSRDRVNLDEFLQQNSEIPKILLFTEKTSTSPLFKALSLEFQNQLEFAEVRDYEKNLVARFSIKKFPTLLLLRGGEKEEPVVYEGPLKHAQLSEFFSAHVPQKTGRRPNRQGDDDGAKSKPLPAFDPEVHKIFSAETFQRHCLDQVTRGASALCVLAFLPLLEEEFDESVAQHNSFISILKKLKKATFDATATASFPMPLMHFVWLDGSGAHSQKLIRQFELSSDLPSLMVLNPNKHGYAPYIGSFEESKIRRFLQDISRGLGRVFSYTMEINLPSVPESPSSEDSSAQKGSTANSDAFSSSSEQHHDSPSNKNPESHHLKDEL